MKTGNAEQVHKVCLGIVFALWMAAGLCYLADAKEVATGLAVLGVVLELIALLILWFLREDQERDRE